MTLAASITALKPSIFPHPGDMLDVRTEETATEAGAAADIRHDPLRL